MSRRHARRSRRQMHNCVDVGGRTAGGWDRWASARAHAAALSCYVQLYESRSAPGDRGTRPIRPVDGRDGAAAGKAQRAAPPARTAVSGSRGTRTRHTSNADTVVHAYCRAPAVLRPSLPRITGECCRASPRVSSSSRRTGKRWVVGVEFLCLGRAGVHHGHSRVHRPSPSPILSPAPPSQYEALKAEREQQAPSWQQQAPPQKPTADQRIGIDPRNLAHRAPPPAAP